VTGVGVSFDGRDPPDVLLAKADAAASGGAEAVWLATHLFQRDTISTAAVLLGRDPRLKVVLVALSPFVIHPVYIAMATATLAEFYPGRVALCLGVGAPLDLAGAGVAAPAPLGPMREALWLCRSLLAGEAVRFEGRRFRVDGPALASGAQSTPILLAASGPKMLRLAGEAADGVVLSAGASVAYVAWCLEQAKAGGVRPGFQAHAFVYAAVDADGGQARDRARTPLSVVLRGAHHARNLEMAGTPLDQAALAAAYGSGDRAAAEALITDDVVDRHAAAGPADVFARRIRDYRAAGADGIVLAGARAAAEIEAALRALPTG